MRNPARINGTPIFFENIAFGQKYSPELPKK